MEWLQWVFISYMKRLEWNCPTDMSGNVTAKYLCRKYLTCHLNNMQALSTCYLDLDGCKEQPVFRLVLFLLPAAEEFSSDICWCISPTHLSQHLSYAGAAGLASTAFSLLQSPSVKIPKIPHWIYLWRAIRLWGETPDWSWQVHWQSQSVTEKEEADEHIWW